MSQPHTQLGSSRCHIVNRKQALTAPMNRRQSLKTCLTTPNSREVRLEDRWRPAHLGLVPRPPTPLRLALFAFAALLLPLVCQGEFLAALQRLREQVQSLAWSVAFARGGLLERARVIQGCSIALLQRRLGRYGPPHRCCLSLLFLDIRGLEGGEGRGRVRRQVRHQVLLEVQPGVAGVLQAGHHRRALLLIDWRAGRLTLHQSLANFRKRTRGQLEPAPRPLWASPRLAGVPDAQNSSFVLGPLDSQSVTHLQGRSTG